MATEEWNSIRTPKTNGELMSLVAVGVVDRVHGKPKESVSLRTHKLQPGEVHGLSKYRPDQYRPDQYDFVHILSKSNPLTKIQKITILYQHKEVAIFPGWLIGHLVATRTTGVCILSKENLSDVFAMPLDFMFTYPGGDLQIRIDWESDMNETILLITREIFLDCNSRDKLYNQPIPYPMYPIYNGMINSNMFEKQIKFELIGTSLLIRCPYIKYIQRVSIEGGDMVYLDYPDFFLKLYGKWSDDVLEIFFNHKNNCNFYQGLNYGRLDHLIFKIKFASELKEVPISIATKSLNALEYFDSTWRLKYGSEEKFIVKACGENDWYSHFSFTKIATNKFIEGYWNNENSDNMYPNPKGLSVPVDNEFLRIFKSFIIDEKLSKNLFLDEFGKNDRFLIQKTIYLGYSICRCCKKTNGCSEYIVTKKRNGQIFTFPEGLLHYFENHNIHPSEEFRNFVMTD